MDKWELWAVVSVVWWELPCALELVVLDKQWAERAPSKCCFTIWWRWHQPWLGSTSVSRNIKLIRLWRAECRPCLRAFWMRSTAWFGNGHTVINLPLRPWGTEFRIYFWLFPPFYEMLSHSFAATWGPDTTHQQFKIVMLKWLRRILLCYLCSAL